LTIQAVFAECPECKVQWCPPLGTKVTSKGRATCPGCESKPDLKHVGVGCDDKTISAGNMSIAQYRQLEEEANRIPIDSDTVSLRVLHRIKKRAEHAHVH